MAAIWQSSKLVFRSDEQRSQEKARIAELERLAGRLTLELEVAQKVSIDVAFPIPEAIFVFSASNLTIRVIA